MLSHFIRTNHLEIVRRCGVKAANRTAVGQGQAATDGLTLLLNQLASALAGGGTTHVDLAASASLHGHDRLAHGFSLSQVVYDYGDVGQSITDLAMEACVPISTDDFRNLNGCLDDAIAGAVTGYERGTQAAHGAELARGAERLAFLAHELRNCTNTALLAFEVLKTGRAGIAGNTGAVLQRSLQGTRSLIDRALGEVRLAKASPHRERIDLAGFIHDLAHSARLDASSRGLTLVVTPVDDELAIEGDRQVLAAALGNLLQNAFKFTRPGTTVTLRVRASAERILLEVEDECGGLPNGNANDELFRPFEQQSADRTGLGLGLAFSRRGVEADNGRLSARDLPHHGCVFSVDLPRYAVVASLGSELRAVAGAQPVGSVPQRVTVSSIGAHPGALLFARRPHAAAATKWTRDGSVDAAPTAHA